jgi:flagellar biosynthesis/type III secretory pathway protein FliH
LPRPRPGEPASFRADPAAESDRTFHPDPVLSPAPELVSDPALPPEVRPSGEEPTRAAAGPEELARRAYDEGFEAGRSEASAERAEALESAAHGFECAAQLLERRGRIYLRSNRQTLLDLAVALAERILERELGDSPRQLLALVERSLSCVECDGTTRVALGPRDLETARTSCGELLERLERDRGIVFEADPVLGAGDVRVEAGTGEVDARPSELLSRLRAELDAALGASEDTE